MTHSKFSSLLAIMLLVGADAAVPAVAHASEAEAAPLDPAAVHPARVRCFMGMTTDKAVAIRDDLHRGWICIPEQVPALTH